MEQARRGNGRICTLEGMAGIGKTRLVTEVLTAARRRGFQAHYGGGAELEHRRPFGAVVECLGIRPGAGNGTASEIADLLADAAPAKGSIPAEAATTEFRVVEAVLALVEELCARGPVAMALDDLQWADSSTLVVLHRLARHVRGLPALLICSWRPVPRRPELDRLLGIPTEGTVHLVLGPLPTGDMLELLRSVTGATPGANLCRLAASTGGNPLFVHELLGALEREGALAYDGRDRVDSTSPSLPPSLPLAILHRLSYLSEEALELLRVAAVLGTRVDVSDICLLLGRSATSLMGTFSEVTAAAILEDGGDRLVFRHDVIREALYHDLPSPVRAAMHRDAARALAEAGAPPDRVAEHASRGAVAGDRFAIAALRRAAADAVNRAPAVAAEWLDRALELTAPDDPVRDALASERAVSLLWSGRVVEAEKACRDLLAGPVEPSLRCGVRLCLAQALFARGRAGAAVEVAEAAASQDELSAVERAHVRAWISLGYMATGEMERAGTAADAALADPGADAFATAVALTTKATAVNFCGRFGESVALQGRAIATAEGRGGRSAHRFPLHFFHALFLVEIDDLDGAARALAEGRRVNEETGGRWNLPLYSWASAWVRYVAGEWDDALAECEASLALADELGTRHGLLLAHSLQAMIALHRGELEVAERCAFAAEAEFTATGRQHGLENVMVWARALVAEAAGDVVRAAAALGRAWDDLTGAGVSGYRLDLGPDLVRLASAIGDGGRAQAVTAAVEELTPLNPGLRRVAGTAMHCLGLVRGDAATLAEAARLLEGCSRPFEAARACEDAAGALARTGELAQSRRYYDAALRLFERVGAWRAIDRTEACMREQGLRRGRRAERPRPASGWESLTPTERRVADLAASGLTNPQIAQRLFVSRHTVHTHLSHVLGKLGLSSRVELAAEAALRRTEKVGQDAKEMKPADERNRRASVDRHPT